MELTIPANVPKRTTYLQQTCVLLQATQLITFNSFLLRTTHFSLYPISKKNRTLTLAHNFAKC